MSELTVRSQARGTYLVEPVLDHMRKREENSDIPDEVWNQLQGNLSDSRYWYVGTSHDPNWDEIETEAQKVIDSFHQNEPDS